MKKILAIDDDISILLILKLLLEQENFEVVTFEEVTHLDKTLKEDTYDLILLDYNIGAVSGLDVILYILSLKISTPIIMLTGDEKPETLQKCLEAGASDFVNKPIVPIILLARIKSVLNHFENLNQIQKQKEEIFESQKQLQILLNYIQKDLEKAKSTQKKLIPEKLVNFEFFNLYSFYKPMDQVGGDFFSYKKKGSFKYLIFGDVSGHGVSSAMISCLVVLCFKMMDHDLFSIATELEFMHKTLEKYIFNHYVTLTYFRINTRSKILDYCYAAHHPMILIRNSEIIELQGKGTPLILIKSFMSEQHSYQLETGDKLFLFSDGVFELFDKNKLLLGYDDFLLSLKSKLNLNIEDFIHSVSEDSLKYSDYVLKDDMTMLIVEVL